jgi:hypothetical protein
MSLKQPLLAMAAAALCAVVGSAPVSARENCGFMYQRIMEAYQTQSPNYRRMFNRYNARCLSSGSSQPASQRRHRNNLHDQGYYRHDHERRADASDRWRRGW